MKITAKNLTKCFTIGDGSTLEIISQLSCSFPDRCSISIRGPSGVGKSTFLHMLAGLEPVDSGALYLGEVDIAKLNADELAAFRRDHIGMIFQFHHLLPEFTALENIALPLLISGMSDDEAMEKALKVLARVGLDHRSEHRPSMLSGGEQQRVAVGRAVVKNPALILADEPTGNLDPETGRAIGELLLELQEEEQSTLVVVTHSDLLGDALEVHYEMQSGGMLNALGQGISR